MMGKGSVRDETMNERLPWKQDVTCGVTSDTQALSVLSVVLLNY